uniref:Uncharacterized protein n=1 Tax=Kalanchoe fedtschenkoi TaxID=63787 RepID=A0A7N0ZQK0_KALFE
MLWTRVEDVERALQLRLCLTSSQARGCWKGTDWSTQRLVEKMKEIHALSIKIALSTTTPQQWNQRQEANAAQPAA